jgi:hypothetical protein
MIDYLSGAVTMGFVVAALFFLRFWARTRDGLFGIFAAAFLMMALNQALVTLGGIAREEQSWIYLLRLAAFVLIIVAIARKNVARWAGVRGADCGSRPREALVFETVVGEDCEQRAAGAERPGIVACLKTAP